MHAVAPRGDCGEGSAGGAGGGGRGRSPGRSRSVLKIGTAGAQGFILLALRSRYCSLPPVRARVWNALRAHHGAARGLEDGCGLGSGERVSGWCSIIGITP